MIYLIEMRDKVPLSFHTDDDQIVSGFRSDNPIQSLKLRTDRGAKPCGWAEDSEGTIHKKCQTPHPAE